MPFTPFHMGPGLAVKAVCGHYFSLMVFGFSQVAIDIEPLVRMIRGDVVLHGLTHTYLGATVIAVLSVVVGRPVCQFLLNYWPPDPYSPFLNWLRGPKVISWPASIAGAFVGTYSHIFLDSVMHSDMQRSRPSRKPMRCCTLSPLIRCILCAYSRAWSAHSSYSRSSSFAGVPTLIAKPNRQLHLGELGR
jgi:hypothetical protein